MTKGALSGPPGRAMIRRMLRLPPAAPIAWVALLALALPALAGAAAAGDGEPVVRTDANPFRRGDVWVGQYVCSQGVTELRFHVAGVRGDRVRAVFDFHHVPSGAVGRYEMRGTWYPAERRAVFVAGAWIDQPPGYITVDMEGRVHPDGRRFGGQIVTDSPGCSWFRLVRRSAGDRP
jgi:hypothetical protein